MCQCLQLSPDPGGNYSRLVKLSVPAVRHDQRREAHTTITSDLSMGGTIFGSTMSLLSVAVLSCFVVQKSTILPLAWPPKVCSQWAEPLLRSERLFRVPLSKDYSLLRFASVFVGQVLRSCHEEGTIEDSSYPRRR